MARGHTVDVFSPLPSSFPWLSQHPQAPSCVVEAAGWDDSVPEFPQQRPERPSYQHIIWRFAVAARGLEDLSSTWAPPLFAPCHFRVGRCGASSPTTHKTGMTWLHVISYNLDLSAGMKALGRKKASCCRHGVMVGVNIASPVQSLATRSHCHITGK